MLKSILHVYCIVFAIISVTSALENVAGSKKNFVSSAANKRVKRGNYGQQYSGGLGSDGSLGVGYGGTNVAGASFSGVGGPSLVFDSLALKAVSVPNNAFVSSYQAQINAASSSGQGLDYAQQAGQHSAAAAGFAANQVGNWYNTIATGPVPSGYKGGL